MSSGGGATKTQTVTQNNQPWSGVQPQLTDAYNKLGSVVNQGAPSYYPGQTVADLSPQTNQAIQGVTNLATQGNQTLTDANKQLDSTINGDYLNAGNPYFSQMISQIRQPVDSSYALAGRYGSGAHDQAIANAAGGLAYQNYAAERQNQMGAISQAPAIDQAQYYGLNQLGNVGSVLQQQGQNVINSNIDQYNYNQNKDYNWLNQYIGTLNGATGSSQSTTSPVYSPSPWSQIAGAGIGAAGLLSQFL